MKAIAMILTQQKVHVKISGLTLRAGECVRESMRKLSLFLHLKRIITSTGSQRENKHSTLFLPRCATARVARYHWDDTLNRFFWTNPFEWLDSIYATRFVWFTTNKTDIQRGHVMRSSRAKIISWNNMKLNSLVESIFKNLVLS